MPARLSIVAFIAALLATTPLSAAAASDTEAVTCSGVFGPESSEALVRQTFGTDNVTTGIVPGPEGTEMLATTVFPDDPDRAMQFGWFDEENRAYLSYVELAPGQISPGFVRLCMCVA